jgi:hypothetical protein
MRPTQGEDYLWISNLAAAIAAKESVERMAARVQTVGMRLRPNERRSGAPKHWLR